MLQILHITNEITKKNFSISSLINFISEKGKKKKIFNSEVLCSNTDVASNSKKLFIRRIKWKNFFKLRRIFLDVITNYDVIHIHGMWAPIQLYSIILCLIYSKKIIIHPHGMLLKPAIDDNGFFKKINKRIFLYVFKILINNQKNITFVAITNEEYSEIKHLFSNLNVELIQNNIPFENFCLSLEKPLNYKKTFVFFGRIHPHKNIIKMMRLFVDSDLIKQGWSLEIYGIPDDKNYLNQIQKFSSNFPQIKILNPVFGIQKAKIMNRSWANILISKSEVLSFSVLEAGVYGLPSVITNNIETLKKDKISQKVKNNSEKILNKFIEISSWSTKNRQLFGNKTSLFFNRYKKDSDKIILQSLSIAYRKIFNKKIHAQVSSSENFYIASLVHSLNVFMPNLILLFSFFSFKSELAAEIGLTNIIFITLTQMLSGNIRLIAIRKQDVGLLQNNLLFRLIMGIIFLFCFQFISNRFLLFDSHFTNFIISCLIILLWCSELVLSIFEIKRKIGKMIIILLFYFIFLIFILSTFLLNNLLLVQISISISCLFLLLFCVSGINFKTLYELNIATLKSYTLNFLKYFSSLSFTLSSFCWRFYLYFTYPKEISGIIFIAFAICSFPGTFFNNVLGPNFFYNKITINSKIKYFFITIFICLIIYNFITYQNISLNDLDKDNLFYHIIKISSVGSFLMFYGMYIRQSLVFTKKINLDNLFYKDIFYGLLLITILPVLDKMGSLNLLSFSYLIGSIFAVLIFNNDKSIGFKFKKIKI
jgi:glycosyltransferase involved in cell wall biosynthesis